MLSVQLGVHAVFRVLRQGLCAMLPVWLLALGATAQATPVVSIDKPSQAPLGNAMAAYAEPASPLSFEVVKEVFKRGQFQHLSAPVSGFGVGHRPVWLYLAVENPTVASLSRQLLIGQTWLDRVDVYVLSPGQPNTHYTVGDALPGMPRLTGPQGFLVEHAFLPGRSEIFFRVQTPDPMVFNLHLRTAQQAAEEARLAYYGYGILYGFLLSLAAYNALLFVGLGRRVHLWYAVYLLSFIVLNIAYTGHGAYWLWSAQTGFQNYFILIMMVLMPCFGLRFAQVFLELSARAPRLNRAIQAGCGAALGALALAVMIDAQGAAALIAFVAMAIFIFAMVGLGVHGIRKQWNGARYFLAAALASMLGTALTEFSVWGFIPFNPFTFHGMELGMMLDATILALALAYFVRVQMSQRARAEQEARRDMLTGLYNRRGFLEQAEAPFLVASRHARPLSIVLLDIDHFKAINDQHGHAAGDRVLAGVARFLSSTGRGGDVTARWGGEEFILLLPETDRNAACQLAERLRTGLLKAVVNEDVREMRVSASFGVSSLERQQSLMELLNSADQALYAAKAAGRNQVAGASVEDAEGK